MYVISPRYYISAGEYPNSHRTIISYLVSCISYLKKSLSQMLRLAFETDFLYYFVQPEMLSRKAFIVSVAHFSHLPLTSR